MASARAFILKPQLLLADEPTGDLDVETEQEVMGLFRKLHRRGVTLAMVTHERQREIGLLRSLGAGRSRSPSW